MRVINFSDNNLTCNSNRKYIYIDNFENECELKWTYTNIFPVSLFVENYTKTQDCSFEFDLNNLAPNASKDITIKIKKPKDIYQVISLSISFEEVGVLNYGSHPYRHQISFFIYIRNFALFDYKMLFGYTRTINYKTDIFTSQNGTENRVALMNKGIMEFDFGSVVLEPNNGLREILIYGLNGSLLLLPLWEFEYKVPFRATNNFNDYFIPIPQIAINILRHTGYIWIDKACCQITSIAQNTDQFTKDDFPFYCQVRALEFTLRSVPKELKQVIPLALVSPKSNAQQINYDSDAKTKFDLKFVEMR